MVAEGHSQTMHSRHLTGHAVDVDAFVNGAVSWDWPLYERIRWSPHLQVWTVR